MTSIYIELKDGFIEEINSEISVEDKKIIVTTNIFGKKNYNHKEFEIFIESRNELEGADNLLLEEILQLVNEENTSEMEIEYFYKRIKDRLEIYNHQNNIKTVLYEEDDFSPEIWLKDGEIKEINSEQEFLVFECKNTILIKGFLKKDKIFTIKITSITRNGKDESSSCYNNPITGRLIDKIAAKTLPDTKVKELYKTLKDSLEIKSRKMEISVDFEVEDRISK